MDGDNPSIVLPQFTICDLGAVRSYFRQQMFSHVISIWGAGAADFGPDEIRSFFPAAKIHVARFDDIEFESASAVTKHIVQSIPDFGSGLHVADKVLVHCLAGVARSSGVAFALACQYAGPGHESAVLQTLVAQSPWIKPNRRVVAYSDEILRRGGRMNAAVSALRAKFIARRVD